MPVAILKISYAPFNQIQYIKSYKYYFSLLSCMNAFIVYNIFVYPRYT